MLLPAVLLAATLTAAEPIKLTTQPLSSMSKPALELRSAVPMPRHRTTAVIGSDGRIRLQCSDMPERPRIMLKRQS